MLDALALRLVAAASGRSSGVRRLKALTRKELLKPGGRLLAALPVTRG
jgi:hypothetical protein